MPRLVDVVFNTTFYSMTDTRRSREDARSRPREGRQGETKPRHRQTRKKAEFENRTSVCASVTSYFARGGRLARQG